MDGAGDPGANIFLVVLIVVYWMWLGNLLGTQPRQNDGQAKQRDLPAGPRSGNAEDVTVSSASMAIIQAVGRNFNTAAFLSGAENAYEVVLRAFAEGDTGTLKRLVGPDVFDTFERAIQGRRERQETLQLMFVGMRTAAIVSAVKEEEAIEIGVRFVADVVTATRSTDGTIVAGNAQQIVEVEDAWTFAADVEAKSLNWKLVATASYSA